MIYTDYKSQNQSFSFMDTILNVRELSRGMLANEIFTFPFLSSAYCIVILSQGQCILKGKHSKEFFIGGQVFIGFPDTPVSIQAIGNTHFFYLLLEGMVAEKICYKLADTFGQILSVTSLFRLTDILEKGQNHTLDDYHASILGYQLLTELYRNSGYPNAPSYPQLVKNGLELIEKQYAFVYGVEEIAESLNVSKNHFIRVFTQAVGISPGKYLVRRRIQGAKNLMDNGETSVEAIAAACGFSNGNYFTKVFKKLENCTPTAYMKKHKTKNIHAADHNIYIL